jgi:hypothetical protein
MIYTRSLEAVAQKSDSWLQGAAQDYLRYFAAAVMAIPAGIAYAYLTTHSMEQWWTVLLVLLVGVLLAHLGWVVASRLSRTETSPAVSRPSSPKFEHWEPNWSDRRGGGLMTGTAVIGSAAVFTWLIIGLWFLLVIQKSH